MLVSAVFTAELINDSDSSIIFPFSNVRIILINLMRFMGQQIRQQFIIFLKQNGTSITGIFFLKVISVVVKQGSLPLSIQQSIIPKDQTSEYLLGPSYQINNSGAEQTNYDLLLCIKSAILTQLLQNSMFEGVMSPCTIFLECKYITPLQLWEVELLFLVYYVSNYILKYFATSNADDKFQQIISSWRLFMNYSLTQEGQKYDFDRIRPQSTIQSRYLIFQKGKIEITTCNKRTAMTKINAVEDVQGRSTNSLNKLRQF
ncbi:Hypothetical_protein [Hexamita inflata]|uniref:Hypothetical_protein n=1 Tax=Hexamita inflata TaxID=28002 RepID=A0AA86UHN8_9EUKA|nr:Hypothetical protein HINF_LOCUS39167 [Hexamita inflata]